MKDEELSECKRIKKEQSEAIIRMQSSIFQPKTGYKDQIQLLTEENKRLRDIIEDFLAVSDENLMEVIEGISMDYHQLNRQNNETK